MIGCSKLIKQYDWFFLIVFIQILEFFAHESMKNIIDLLYIFHGMAKVNIRGEDYSFRRTWKTQVTVFMFRAFYQVKNSDDYF